MLLDRQEEAPVPDDRSGPCRRSAGGWCKCTCKPSTGNVAQAMMHKKAHCLNVIPTSFKYRSTSRGLTRIQRSHCARVRNRRAVVLSSDDVGVGGTSFGGTSAAHVRCRHSADARNRQRIQRHKEVRPVLRVFFKQKMRQETDTIEAVLPRHVSTESLFSFAQPDAAALRWK